MKNVKTVIPILLLFLAAGFLFLPKLFGPLPSKWVAYPAASLDAEGNDRRKLPVIGADFSQESAESPVDDRTQNDPKRQRAMPAHQTFAQGFSGQVISKEGTYLAKARVYLMKTRSSQQWLRDMVDSQVLRKNVLKKSDRVAALDLTDTSGTFHLGVEPNTTGRPYHLHVVAEGHVIHTRMLFVKKGVIVRLGMIHLEPGCMLRGRVIAADNMVPIPDAVVQVISQSQNLSAANPEQAEGVQVKSDAQGYYHIEGLQVDQPLRVIVTARGFANWHLSLEIKSDKPQQTQDFELRRGYDIEGFIVDPDNKPIAEAVVRASPFSQQNATFGNSTTDHEGHFLLTGLAEGQYAIAAEADGYGRNETLPVKAGATQVMLALEPLGAVRVIVVDKKAKPVTNYRLDLRTSFPQAETFGRSTMPSVNVRSAKGEKMLRGVPPGSYVFEVNTSSKFAKTYSERFVVIAGSKEEVKVRIVMGLGGSLTGRILDHAGKPIARAQIATLDMNFMDNAIWETFRALILEHNSHISTRSDEQGRFRIHGLTPGKYQIRLDHVAYVRQYRKGFDVAEGENIDIGDITLTKGARLTGKVFRMGTALANAKVSITSKAGPRNKREQQNSIYLQVRTDENGSYKAGRRLPAGIYELSAYRVVVANPFLPILDMQKSKVEVELLDGQAVRKDIHLSR